MAIEEYTVSQTDVMDLMTADRYAICERDTRRLVILKRSSGTSLHMTYKSEHGANAGLGRASAHLTDTALMVVDRHAE